jgi:hypothetical protein
MDVGMSRSHAPSGCLSEIAVRLGNIDPCSWRRCRLLPGSSGSSLVADGQPWLLYSLSSTCYCSKLAFHGLTCYTAEEVDDFLIHGSTQTHCSPGRNSTTACYTSPTADDMGNIQTIPPSVLKSWPTPNYDDPIRRTWMPIFVMVWQVASTMLVWLRFYLRVRHLAGPFGYDDAFMLVAWVSRKYPFIACFVADYCLRSR